MSLYKLIERGTLTVSNGPAPIKSVKVGTLETANQQFHLVAHGTGTISVSVQVVGSNGGDNWMAVGDPITASASPSGIAETTAQAAMTGNAPWAWFGAYVTAISPANATATLTMNA